MTVNAILRLLKAFGNLADSLNGLAVLIDTTSGRLRQALALEPGLEPAGEPAALPAPAGEAEADGNGQAEGGPAAQLPAPGKRGKKAAAA
jgi:hypothetical protein